MKLINLTAEPVVLQNGVVIHPDDWKVKVDERLTQCGPVRLKANHGEESFLNVPIFRNQYLWNDKLPPSVPEIGYIVDDEVARAAKNRLDLFVAMNESGICVGFFAY